MMVLSNTLLRVMSFFWRALGCRLWWSRRDWSPATRALLDRGVVALRVVTIVPIRLWGCDRNRRRRCNIDCRRRCDDHWRVGIGSPIRSPIRSPVRSNPDEHTRASEPMMASESMMASEPMMPAIPAAPPPGIPWPNAGHEQHCDDHDHHHPLVCGVSESMMPLTHRALLLRLPACLGSGTADNLARPSPRAGSRGALGASRPMVTVCAHRIPRRVRMWSSHAGCSSTGMGCTAHPYHASGPPWRLGRPSSPSHTSIPLPLRRLTPCSPCPLPYRQSVAV